MFMIELHYMVKKEQYADLQRAAAYKRQHRLYGPRHFNLVRAYVHELGAWLMAIGFGLTIR